jgi:hypothetical protein
MLMSYIIAIIFKNFPLKWIKINIIKINFNFLSIFQDLFLKIKEFLSNIYFLFEHMTF